MKITPMVDFISRCVYLAILLLLVASCSKAIPSLNHPRSDSSSSQVAKVVRVIDGDTIEVDINGHLHTVRYIGIDTPETKHPKQGVEPYAREASTRNHDLVHGKVVRLENDISETDRYNRLLRYVYIEDVMVNALLVEEGYAQVSTYPPDVKYVDLFQRLQNEAAEKSRGLWSVQVRGLDAIGNKGCDTSYPTVCITPPPPDLNCDDISHNNFKVISSDPHRFDGNNNGIGCEK